MAQLLLANPARRRRRKKSTTVAKRRKSPRRALAMVKRTSVRRYRRNPIKMRGIMDQVQGAAVGAAGALAVDVAMSKLPLPAALQTGPMKYAAQGLVSIGIGMLVGKVFKNRKLGTQLADGGLTVGLYGAGKTLLAGTVPGLAGDELLGADLLGIQDVNQGVGWYSPAPTSMSGYDSYSGETDFMN